LGIEKEKPTTIEAQNDEDGPGVAVFSIFPINITDVPGCLYAV
jgi:hypothetical protein